jgi:hypothetical protein
VAAAGLADVGPADLHPLEVLWRGDHLPHQLAIAGLDPGPLMQLRPGVGNSLRQLVAETLQLTEIEHAWLRGDRGDVVIELNPTESLGEEPGQLALETTDLTAQLRARSELVDLDAKPIQAVSLEQIHHRPGTECRSRSGSAGQETIKQR